MNGILCVYKEAGYTSHDVINRLRRISNQKKIGHTGTLDPNAEGVLPVCFGNATKVCGLLTDTDKCYRAELILGKVTDSYDITGEVITEQPVHVTAGQLKEVIKSFIGTQMQTPPMFSARKINGQKLYDLARQGIVVEREQKEITVYDICLELLVCRNEYETEFEIEAGNLDAAMLSTEVVRAFITVHCSKGTYIRSICHDIGTKLGCGACMGSLLRTKVGRFTVEDSKKIKELAQIAEEGKFEELLISADSMFPEYPKLGQLPEEADVLLRNGNQIYLNMLSKYEWMAQEKVQLRMYDHSGRFCAIYEYRKDKRYLQPVTMFPEYNGK